MDRANHAARSLSRGLSRRFAISSGLRELSRPGVLQLNSCQVTKVVSVNAEHLAERPMIRPGDVKQGPSGNSRQG